MAKGDFYFPLHYQKLITSTIGWRDDEFGAYVRLLISQFDKGSIPKEVKELARISTSIKKNWKRISEKFVDDGKGNLINIFMDEIRQDVNKKKIKNKENGLQGGRPLVIKHNQIRFYLLKCSNEDELFYKAGITNDSISKRFDSINGKTKKIPYLFTVEVDVLCDFKIGQNIESELEVNCEKYFPKLHFGGHLECFIISEKVTSIINRNLTETKATGLPNETQTKAILIDNSKYIKEREESPTVFYKIEDCFKIALRDARWVKANGANSAELTEFNKMLERRGLYEKNPADYKSHFANWKLSGKKEIFEPEQIITYKNIT